MPTAPRLSKRENPLRFCTLSTTLRQRSSGRRTFFFRNKSSKAIGSANKAWQRKAVNHIFSMQCPDGGWNIYYGGPSEVNATIKGYLALKLAGVPVTDARMLRAREMALHLGGVPRMNTFSR